MTRVSHGTQNVEDIEKKLHPSNIRLQSILMHFIELFKV